MPDFPMRINKYLAQHNYATRRGADDLIRAGKVFINDKRAELGDQVTEHDTVTVRNFKAPQYTYRAYYKPRGETTGPHDGLNPIGRLDKESEGLLLLTDDGRITDRLLNPEFNHEKEYLVTVVPNITPAFLKRMGEGVEIEGYMTRPAKVVRKSMDTFTITLTEGKKHQIRRMCIALRHNVKFLKRIRIMNIKLGTLKPGNSRDINQSEVQAMIECLLPIRD